MSETVTVRRREFGFSLMDDCGSTAYVPDDDAPAIALALLGPGWEIVPKTTAESGKSGDSKV